MKNESRFWELSLFRLDFELLVGFVDMDLETLKGMKRHELQQEAKRIGIKANQASSVLIDLIKKHYEVGK